MPYHEPQMELHVIKDFEKYIRVNNSVKMQGLKRSHYGRQHAQNVFDRAMKLLQKVRKGKRIPVGYFGLVWDLSVKSLYETSRGQIRIDRGELRKRTFPQSTKN